MMGFSMYPLDIEKRKRMLNPSFNQNADKYKYSFNNNMTFILFLDVLMNLRTSQHEIITVYGKTGSGKSYIGLTLSLFMSKVTGIPLFPKEVLNLNVGKLVNGKWDFVNYGSDRDRETLIRMYNDNEINIALNRDKLKAIIESSVDSNKYQGATWILDERPKSSKIGSGAKKVGWYVADIQDMMRSLSMNFVRISPMLEDDEAPSFAIESQKEFDFDRRLSKGLIYDVVNNKIQQYPSGYVIIKSPPIKILEIYEFIKLFNQKKFLKGKIIDERIKKLDDSAKILINHKDWKEIMARNFRYKTKLLQKKMREIFGAQFTTPEYKELFAEAMKLESIKKENQLKTLISKEDKKDMSTEFTPMKSSHVTNCKICLDLIIPAKKKNPNMIKARLIEEVGMYHQSFNYHWNRMKTEGYVEQKGRKWILKPK